jgi:hypothetical protein
MLASRQELGFASLLEMEYNQDIIYPGIIIPFEGEMILMVQCGGRRNVYISRRGFKRLFHGGPRIAFIHYRLYLPRR